MAEDNEDPREVSWHPRFATEVVGHVSEAARFREAVAGGRPHHAWLITGPRGIGKATLAYKLAGEVLALANAVQTPRWIAARSHPDLFVLERGLKALSAVEFEAAAETTDAIVLDVRTAGEFCKGFIPKSINIGLKGDFAPWVGALIIDVKQPILLVTSEGDEQEAVTRLARVGFDHVVGYLKGGFQTWKESGKEIDQVERISATQFKNELKIGDSKVVDVRKESEYAAEHVEEAYSRPLSDINAWFAEYTSDEPFYLHCQGGYRSMIAASILKARGIHQFKEVEGGFKSIAETGVPKSDFVCQSKMIKS